MSDSSTLRRGETTQELLELVLRTCHDPALFETGLRDVYRARAAVKAFAETPAMKTVGLEADFLPVFLHGAPADGKIVIVGINPGIAPADRVPSQMLPGITEDCYLHDQHRRYFQRPTKELGLYWQRVTTVLSDYLDQPVPATDAEKWAMLGKNCVGHDLVPFASPRDKMSRQLTSRKNNAFRRLAQASVEGLANTRARMIWVFGMAPFLCVVPALTDRSDRTLSGLSRAGNVQSMQATVGSLGRCRVVAVDHFLFGQGQPYPANQYMPQLRALWA